MKQVKAIVLLIIIGILAGSENLLYAQSDNDYRDLWKKAETQEKRDLPESTLKELEKIVQLAKSEKNYTQWLKAEIAIATQQLKRDPDQLQITFNRLETLLEELPEKPEKAIGHTLLADMYFSFCRSRFYDNTVFYGDEPDRIQEWSLNHFATRIYTHLQQSFAHPDYLQEVSYANYKTLFDTNEADEYNGSLYNYLTDKLIRNGHGYIHCFNKAYKQSNDWQKWILLNENMLFATQPEAASEYDFAYLTATLCQQRYRIEADHPDRRLQLILTIYRSFAHPVLNQKEQLEILDRLIESYSDQPAVADLYCEKYNALSSLFNSLDYTQVKTSSADTKLLQKKREFHQQCMDIVQKFANYSRIDALQHCIDIMEQPVCNLTLPLIVSPNGEEYQMKLTYKHIPGCDVTFYRIKDYREIASFYDHNLNKRSKEKVAQLHISLPNADLLCTKDTLIALPKLPYGVYCYTIDKPESKVEQQMEYFVVTSLMAVHKVIGSTQDTIEILTIDRLSGKPCPKVDIRLYQRNYGKQADQLLQQVKSDKNGLVLLKLPTKSNKRYYDYYYTVSRADEEELFKNDFYSMPYNLNNNEEQEKVELFTDRSIYRPGQTIYFKGIAVSRHCVITQRPYTVILYDANRETVSETTLTTNEYGSFSGTFVLPTSKLNGNYTVGIKQIPSSMRSFRVEEYKRPTYEITFSPITQSYQLGDRIELSGMVKGFNGVPVKSRESRYTVTRNAYFYIPGHHFSNEQIAEGRVTIHDDGTFKLPFTAIAPEGVDHQIPAVYRYTVELTVTDLNGETRQQHEYIAVGNRSMWLHIEGDYKVTDDALFRFNAVNLQGKAIETKGKWILYELNDYESFTALHRHDTLSIRREVAQGSCNMPQEVEIPFGKLNPGRYRLRIEANDPQGRLIYQEKDIIRYNLKENRPPILIEQWLITERNECRQGEDAIIHFGTSFRDAYVLYELFDHNHNTLHRTLHKLHNEIKRFTVPYQETFKNGVTAQFTFIKEGRLYKEEVTITQKQPDMGIKTEITTFRDKLTPGSQEHWNIHLSNSEQQLSEAELLAAMYDQSLDQFVPHQWNTGLFSTYRRISVPHWSNDYANSKKMLTVYFSLNEPAVHSFYSPNWHGLTELLYPSRQLLMPRAAGIGGKNVQRKMQMYSAQTSNKVAVVQDMAATDETLFEEEVIEVQSDNGNKESLMEEVTLRKNLQETAFFYPHLYTNKNGEIDLTFTVPESLTRWRFMSLAHTSDLKYGLFTAECMTQKEVMITPNLPRFFREGDHTSVSAKVDNLTDKTLTATAVIELFDPFTEKPYEGFAKKQTVHVKAQNSTTCQWDITLPPHTDLIGIKIAVTGEKHSDGEQHVLPILSNKQLITESMPITVQSNTQKRFTLPLPSSKSLQPYSMTLEYTTNPTWYAIQALPDLQMHNPENTINVAAIYYSSIVAQAIIQSNPRIAQIIKLWQQDKEKGTLLSFLEKNENLKSTLLQETPWVMDAKNDTEHKQHLIQLLDYEQQRQKTAYAITLLERLQQRDGGWGWFSGMKSNETITQQILLLMSRIVSLNSYEFSEKERLMQVNALRYIDRTIARMYEQQQRWDPQDKQILSNYQLTYLYLRNCYQDIPVDGESKAAFDFYLGKLKKKMFDHKNIYNKAAGALTLYRYGEKASASELLKSLREYAIHSEELGMYWKQNNNRYGWYEDDIATHCLLMQAFNEIDLRTEEIDQMKIWLLKQKQTRTWRHIPATLEAVSALLLKGTDLLADTAPTTIQWGTTFINPSEQEVGTGYVQKSVQHDFKPADYQTVQIDQKGNSIGWGALYYQYFEEMDQVKASNNQLQVKREFAVETNGPNGKIQRPLKANDKLKVGDKLVTRIFVTTDRTMEFVHLKDLYPACGETLEQLSGYRFNSQVGYYQTSKDASMNYFFDILPKGNYRFEHSVYITRNGEYTIGPATIQCMYAPEFTSHSSGERIIVTE